MITLELKTDRELNIDLTQQVEVIQEKAYVATAYVNTSHGMTVFETLPWYSTWQSLWYEYTGMRGLVLKLLIDPDGYIQELFICVVTNNIKEHDKCLLHINDETIDMLEEVNVAFMFEHKDGDRCDIDSKYVKAYLEVDKFTPIYVSGLLEINEHCRDKLDNLEDS